MTSENPKPRLHRPLLKGILPALQKIFFENYPAETAVAKALKTDSRWGSRDRAFVAESIYDIVRWWRLYWKLIDSEPIPDEEKFILLIAVNELLNGHSIPDWSPFSGLTKELLLNKKSSFVTQPEVIHSIPDWLHQRGLMELGNVWLPELEAMNQSAPLVIRVNTLKTNKEELISRLKAEGYNANPIEGFPFGLKIEATRNLSNSSSFREGWFELQDAGSQEVALFLDPQPGEIILDACAGAGGKTLHLAALMQNQGKLIAMDPVTNKIKELKRRAERNGVSILETKIIHDTNDLLPFIGTIDRLLLDVPCSGTGVIRRKPDTKWKLSEKNLANVSLVQAEILNNYWKVLKPGGKMVYATCSIFPSENEKQVKKFLLENPQFKLLKEKTFSPAKNGTDGFYMAMMGR